MGFIWATAGRAQVLISGKYIFVTPILIGRNTMKLALSGV
jgi:hypothetical protein